MEHNCNNCGKPGGKEVKAFSFGPTFYLCQACEDAEAELDRLMNSGLTFVYRDGTQTTLKKG